MKLYHGTSFENYSKIVKTGFDHSETIWLCSDQDHMYFWNPRKLMKNEEYNYQNARNEAIRRAFESARITAAYNKSISNKIIVFEIEIPGKLVSDDDSCKNMESSSQVSTDDLNEYGRITDIYYTWYSPYLSLIYLANLPEDYIDLYRKFDLEEIKLIKVLGEQNLDYEEFFVIDHWEVKTKYDEW